MYYKRSSWKITAWIFSTVLYEAKQSSINQRLSYNIGVAWNWIMQYCFSRDVWKARSIWVNGKNRVLPQKEVIVPDIDRRVREFQPKSRFWRQLANWITSAKTREPGEGEKEEGEAKVETESGFFFAEVEVHPTALAKGKDKSSQDEERLWLHHPFDWLGCWQPIGVTVSYFLELI